MFIFNLSSIAPTERVLRAHVHLYKRKSPSRKRRSRKRAETELVLYEVAPHYLSQTGTIIMRMSSWGWQWYGATESVLSCLLADRRHPHLFALSFRAEKPNGKTRTLALKKFVRHHSLPFLILYSNETESVNLEELDIVAERLKQREGDEQLEQPADNVQESDEDKDRSDSSEENEDHDQWDESEESDDGDQWADSEDVDDDGLVESDFGSDDDDDDSDEENDSSDSDFDENNFDAVEEIAKNIQEGSRQQQEEEEAETPETEEPQAEPEE
nr:hypothetical protein BaRGS_008595 [Batillaria attramentaria]